MLELLWIALSECYFFLSYMSGRNAFPQKLTPEQERDCLDRMLRGDEDARSTLIEHNLRLVAHVAKKYQSTGMESDDLISIGTVGLIKAVKTFSPVSGTSLATYAARCIENEILMVIRAGKKQRREVSLQEPVGTDKEGNEISLLEILGTDRGEVEEEVERRDERGALRRLIETTLTPRRAHRAGDALRPRRKRPATRARGRDGPGHLALVRSCIEKHRGWTRWPARTAS